jgi:hypothetical protein
MKPRDRQMLAVVVVVLVAIGGWFIAVRPTRSQAGKLQTQIASAQSQLSQAEAQVAAGLTAESQYTAYARQLKSIGTAVPADSQIPGLINELQAAATRNHIGFQAVTLASGSSSSSTSSAAAGTSTAGSTSSASTTFPSENFTLQFTGRYFTVADLLGTMDKFVVADNNRFDATGRLLTIGSVSFAAGPHGFPGVTASVTLSDYDLPSASLGSGSTSTAAGAPAADVLRK